MTEYANMVKQTLNSLSIKHREVYLKQKVLFFCQILTGQTFDICIENNQIIKIWCFIGKISIEESGFHYEFKKKNTAVYEVGVDVTDEGDLNFYAMQKNGTDDEQATNSFRKLIKRYVSIISDNTFQFINL